MPRLVAFLRAVNVGGRTVRMDRLRELFEQLGFEDVETFIASGNVIFSARTRAGRTLERRIERHLEQELGFEVDTFLRTLDEVAAIASYRPFDVKEMETAGALNVGFLAAPLPPSAHGRLRELESEIDSLHVNGREIYWLCSRKQSESRFNNARFERRLGVRSTFRGLQTVRRLAARHADAGDASRG